MPEAGKSPAALVSEELQDIAAQLDARITEIAGKRISFSLFVWTDGRANYISNSSDRANIKKALRAIIDGWDAGMPDVPVHKIQG